MKYYYEITLWENKRRLEKLATFNDYVVRYFNSTQSSSITEADIEEEERNIRKAINLMIGETIGMTFTAGIPTTVERTSSALSGRRKENVNLLTNLSAVRGKSRHRTVSLDRSMSYGLFCPGTI